MKTMCRLLVLCTLCCLFLPSARGQIVNNPNFQTLNPASPLIICTTANVVAASPINKLQDMCQAWFTPTNGSPDFFYGCDQPYTTADYGVPHNDYFQAPDSCNDASDTWGVFPLHGRAYAGIAIKDSPSASLRDREYITQLLITPLQPSRSYNISFMIRSSSRVDQYLIQRIGCLFTTAAPTVANTSDGNNGAITTSIGNYVDQYNSAGWDASGWQVVYMQVNITGAVRNFITIGNFQEDIPDGEWVPQGAASPITDSTGQAYYVIDNVSICDVCPAGINVERVPSANDSTCCYNVTLLGDNTFCGDVASIEAVTSTGTESVSGPFTPGIPFEFCMERFTSGGVVFKLRDANGDIICQYYKELMCDCQCSQGNPVQSPVGFSVLLQRTTSRPGSCCWNVVVDNNALNPIGGTGCDVRAFGIGLHAGTGTFTPGTGYTLDTTSDGTPYITKNATAGGDIYGHGTSTIIGTFCLPQNTLDLPVYFEVLKDLNAEGEGVECGGMYATTISCADACCDQVASAILVPVSAPDAPPFECCFKIDVGLALPHPCIARVDLQALEGGWQNKYLRIIAPGDMNFSITHSSLCVTAGSSKRVRLLFKDMTGAVVCIKEFTLVCEANCCARIKSLHAYRETINPCCYRIVGQINGAEMECPEITGFIVQQYSNPASSGGWSTVTNGTPNPDGSFTMLACIVPPASGTIRILFHDINGNVVCTRWIQVQCANKAGAGVPFESIVPKAYAVPNPAIDQTTIHYTLREQSEVRMTLFNSVGDIVAEVQSAQLSVGDQTMHISTAQLPSGMYFAQISTGMDIITLPITVVK